MPVLLSIDGSLEAITKEHPGDGYDPVMIGKPMSLELLTFFPGTNIKEWGKKAEIMINSQIRVGPSNPPAPKFVNMYIRKYNFKKSRPIQNWGGDIYGDRMMHYTKAFTGNNLGITLRGVEVDKIDKKKWNAVTAAMDHIGKLALFTPVSPYLAAAKVATKMVKAIISGINRNDRISTQRQDLFFQDKRDKSVLQSGRYILWPHGSGVFPQTLKSKYRLTGTGDNVANILVTKQGNEDYKKSPYFVIRINGKKVPGYDDFEIGASSADLLEKLGDKSKGTAILETVKELANQVNDAKQLREVQMLAKKMKNTQSDEKKSALKEQIKAHMELFTEDNVHFIKDILKDYLT